MLKFQICMTSSSRQNEAIMDVKLVKNDVFRIIIGKTETDGMEMLFIAFVQKY